MLLKTIITGSVVILLTGCIELPTKLTDSTPETKTQVGWATSNNCKIRDDNLSQKRIIVWNGPCSAEGYADGEGTITWTKDNKPVQLYKGTVKKGYVEGTGELRIYSTDGTYNLYKGLVRNEEPSGKGAMRYANGNTYDGDHYNGLRHGEGQFKWQNGNIYKGSWFEGQQQGFGTLVITNKQIYEPYQNKKIGTLKNKEYIVTGMWKMNDLMFECATEQECIKKKDILIKDSEMHGLCKTKTATPTSAFTIKGDEVYDTRTKLTWKRCVVGQSWDGMTCKGDPQKLYFDKALSQYGVSTSGWRIPNIDELVTIRSGISIEDSRKEDSSLAGSTNDGCIYPAYNSIAFPGLSSSWVSSSNDPKKNPEYNKFITSYQETNGHYDAKMMIPSQQLELWSSTIAKDGMYIIDFKDGGISTRRGAANKNENSLHYGERDAVYLRLVKGPSYKGIILTKGQATQLNQGDAKKWQGNEDAFYDRKNKKEQARDEKVKNNAATRAIGNGNRYYTCTFHCSTGKLFNFNTGNELSLTIKADEAWQAEEQGKKEGTNICKATSNDYGVGNVYCNERR